ncbi:glycosyltransferase [Sporolactobacillus sp. THM7-7]|nr:glycosyltransferase [Sporolactobacillus sp. THM7-7]
MKKDILFFPWRDWNTVILEGFARREANIIKSLEKSSQIRKILIVNNFCSLKQEILVKKKISKLKGTIIKDNFFYSISKITEKIFVLNFKIVLPKSTLRIYMNFLNKYIIKSIKQSMNFIGFSSDYITWCCDLFRVKIAAKINKNFYIFDAIDNLLEHDQYKKMHKKVQQLYLYMQKKSDLIFTVSKDLKEKLFGNRKKVYYVPNGVDTSLSNKINSSLPQDLPQNKKPIIGYIGLLQERIDVKLLMYAIHNLKKFNFVFVGAEQSKNYFYDLKKLDNTYFLGAKHHSEIAQYINSFDVCIIPHKVNKFTQSMNPLKLYEYLALSKEVVTTPVPPSQDFSDVIHIAHSKEEFADKISQAIYTPFFEFTKESIKRRMFQESWQKRVESMLEIIDKYLTFTSLPKDN